MNSFNVYQLIVTDSVFGGTFPVKMISSGISSINSVDTLDLLVQYFVVGSTSSQLTSVLVCSIFVSISDFLVYQRSRKISGNAFIFPVGSSGHPVGNNVSMRL